MKILLDEDTPVQLVPPLRHLLGRRHQVEHIDQVGWKAKLDAPVFRDAAQRGYDAVITIDAAQLDDPAETDAIRKSRVHHVRFSQRHAGRAGLGVAMGAVIAAIVPLVDTLERADTQLLVHINGLDPNPARRFTITDPRTDPPRYWQ